MPRRAGSPAAAQVIEGPRAQSQMVRDVYIVDDDEAVRDALRALFEAHGFAVHDFATGTEFLKHVAPTMRGCLVLDVNLPGIDGFEVLRLLLALGSRLPVIIMSARADGHTNTTAIEAGAIGFVQKPFVSGQLVNMVRSALQGQS